MEILAYITDDKERYLGGDPLALLMDEKDREEFLVSLARTLRAEVVRLKNGDHLIVRG